MSRLLAIICWFRGYHEWVGPKFGKVGVNPLHCNICGYRLKVGLVQSSIGAAGIPNLYGYRFFITDKKTIKTREKIR